MQDRNDARSFLSVLWLAKKCQFQPARKAPGCLHLPPRVTV